MSGLRSPVEVGVVACWAGVSRFPATSSVSPDAVIFTGCGWSSPCLSSIVLSERQQYILEFIEIVLRLLWCGVTVD